MYPRYDFILGCKSFDRAEEMLEDAFAHGEVSTGENPRIESYLKEVRGVLQRRWKVTLEDCSCPV
jgi:hypothetical protein